MQESEFHRLADDWLGRAAEVLESADAQGALDAEYENGALTISLPSGQVVVISKHAVTKQIWLASPRSGGLHFSYDGADWTLQDGKTLEVILSDELRALAAITVAW